MLEEYLAHQASTFSLEAARLAGLMLAGPLTWSFMPLRARAGFVVLLTFLVHNPLAAVDMRQASPIFFMLAAMSEFAIGVSIGFVARMVLGAGELAADAIAPVMGLGAAQMFDPNLGGQGSILTRIMRYIGTLIAIGVGLHHLLLAATFRSFTLIPPGTLVNPGVLGPRILRMTSEMLVIGVKLALPLLAVLFIAQVGLAFIARAAPAMQIFSIGFAVTLGVGCMLWIVFAPDLIRELAGLHGWAEANIIDILRILKEDI